jgi:hypothetical protein
MSLFQKSVINKYLKNLNNDKVDKAFESFQQFYGNKLRLVNIMQLKEENYQEGFLREIFVQTLGYTINPDENYNLTTEYKNQKDNRKADSAIIRDGKAIGVIELKSTKTKNLESIKEQAFGYKNNQSGCKYVITSTFRNLRFYIDNATEHEEFNLFHLDKKQFKILYLLLSKDSIFSDLPDKLKQETNFHENDISDKLYEDYKRFKDRIFENLVKNNPQHDKLTLFKKSQKLLDRFLFVFFAEDSGLIPPNAISKIIDQWKVFIEEDEYFTLYSRFQKLFAHLNKGHTYKRWGKIPAYNGGLFREDEILDSSDLNIDDEILEKDSLKLSAYDFNSEVDVNILGHIFEHSLNEIEEITAELSATRGHAPLTKKISKRKKDGIFYTPKYITKYIVENTIGTLCNEQKNKLQINNLLIYDNFRKKDGKLNQKGKQLYETLHNYKKWLLTLKILDPACGSGAFLNQTLDFLIAEHKQADDLLAELTGDNLRLFDTDKAILENNIYGVDINEESVEIAKLSLWLRTAQRGRQLSDLSGNIKCGNSLIDDPKIAGEKAFDWNVEFKKIMDTGGFDVVIGNPPYVMSSINNSEKEYYKNLYNTYEGKPDLYRFFIEKGIKLLNSNSYFSFITPNSFLLIPSAFKLRKFIKSNTSLLKVVNFEGMVFNDANINTVIFVISNQMSDDDIVIVNNKDQNPNEVNFYSSLNNSSLIKRNTYIKNDVINIDLNDREINLISKLKNQKFILNNIAKYTLGLQVYHNTLHPKSDIKNRIYHCDKKNNHTFIPEIGGKHIVRYYINLSTFEYVSIGEWCYNRPDEYFLYGNRILIREIPSQTNLICTMFSGEGVPSKAVIIVKSDMFDMKLLLGLLNSKLIGFYIYKTTEKGKQKLFPRISLTSVKNIPIPEISQENQQPFIEKADLMLSLNQQLQTEKDNFLNTIKEEKSIEKITKKLDAFYDFEYDILKKELAKQKVKFALGNENNEWREYFNTAKQKISGLQYKINQTDKEIDKMVYKLYELTTEEIEIVKSSIK